jgi:hypothetical protein
MRRSLGGHKKFLRIVCTYFRMLRSAASQSFLVLCSGYFDTRFEARKMPPVVL